MSIVMLLGCAVALIGWACYRAGWNDALEKCRERERQQLGHGRLFETHLERWRESAMELGRLEREKEMMLAEAERRKVLIGDYERLAEAAKRQGRAEMVHEMEELGLLGNAVETDC